MRLNAHPLLIQILIFKSDCFFYRYVLIIHLGDNRPSYNMVCDFQIKVGNIII